MEQSLYDDIVHMIEECGFDDYGSCAAADLETRPEVRDMCASGRCQQYGHSWACPPACGTIEDFQQQISEHQDCIVVQTVATLEDEFDFEGMVQADETQKARVAQLAEKLREGGVKAMLLASGTCMVCKECTYPDAPCRFPDRRFTSMEAAGLVVSDVCTLAGVPYNHGKGTIAYSSCVLV